MAGRFEIQAVLPADADQPRRLILLSGNRILALIAVLFALATLASRATSQQVSSPDSPPLSVSSATPADLPAAPDASRPQSFSAQSPSAQSPSAQSSSAQSASGQSAQPPDASATGSIQGTVSNPEGAVYEGVHITLAQPSGFEKTSISDSNGHFIFSGIPSGPFQLTISGSGFATQQISGLLHPGENYQAPPIVLLVSTATTEVRVTVSNEEIAQEELHLEEQQRVFGVIPNFYVVYAPSSPPLNTRQKFHLAWRSSIDPFTFLVTGAAAGIEQATNTFDGYGQGAEGYAKRYGANYADNFIGTMLGGAVLPSLLKQDPRYFVKGSGTTRSRTLYAIANSVICKGDNGHWQFNWSGILGGMAAGGISNIYYPASDRNGVSLTFENAAIGIASSAVTNIFQEFVVRRLTPRLPPQPTYGTPAKP